MERCHLEGQDVWVLVNKFPIFDNTGAVVMVGGAGVDITERKSATFWSRVNLERAAPLAWSSQPEMSKPSVLVVDDNPTNLKLVADVLEFEGNQIAKAADAKDAQRLIKDAPPDIILMDIALPGMDGLELTRRLKSDPATRQIIVVPFDRVCHERRSLKGRTGRL